jgi:hypothetical protein
LNLYMYKLLLHLSNHPPPSHPTCPLLDEDICKRSAVETTLVRDGEFDIVVVDLVVDSKIHAVRVIVTVEVSKTNEANTRLPTACHFSYGNV